MVSGLVTSPCDQLRIFSGDARLMRIASKSAIGFPSSNGFDRNKLSSRGLYATAGGSRIYLSPAGAASCGSSGGSYPDPQDQSAAMGSAISCVGLRGQQFLQDVRCAVGFQRPDFHFSKALSAELRLAAQRLLGDERVRADRAR